MAVLLDGKRVGTISLVSPVRHRRVVLMLPATRLQRATVTVKVRSSGLRVQIDGLVISRS